MNAAENNLVQLLTGKSSLQEVTANELESIIVQYPYFSLAQLLFAKKLKQEQPGNFARQLQHCTIYFQDGAGLQSWLYDKSDAIAAPASTPVQPSVLEANTGEAKTTVENNGDTNLRNDEVENANLLTLPAGDVLDNFSLQIDDVKAEPELPPLDEEELANINETSTEAAAKIADVLQHQVADYKAPVEEKGAMPISTEPYHTIDYFASQGIKIDSQLQDALTKKVHTFTDWLRQMKRISSYPTDLGSDPDMENYVQAIADTSNQPKATDTEAMAEVLVKQGKKDKAIEMYQKLSLLNPGKTAYFAAKINQLKAL